MSFYAFHVSFQETAKAPEALEISRISGVFFLVRPKGLEIAVYHFTADDSLYNGAILLQM